MANIFSILCLAMIVGRFTSTFATDYCKLESCTRYNKVHTMCKYTSSQPSARCTDWSKQGLSDSEKKIIVDKHNELRQKVASGNEQRGNPGPQPPAVSMPNLSWDNELEQIAQRWADQCDFSHDSCRNVDRFQVGQNIAIRMSSSDSPPDLKKVVQSWYDEVAKFDNHQVSSYQFSMATGHYTQVVWAKTTLIGCGRMTYKDKGWITHYIVCNYGPAGNFIGEKIYEIRK